jgi:hypothetical protein
MISQKTILNIKGGKTFGSEGGRDEKWNKEES